MKVVLLWLSQQVIWISLICIAGAVAYVILALSSKRRRNTAQFSLEREIYQQRTTRAWLMALLFMLLAAMILGISIVWGPSTPLLETATATPSSGLFTFTPEPDVQDDTLNASSPITETVVEAPEAQDTPDVNATNTPVPAAMMQPDCPNPDAQITFPVAGSDLSGIVEVRGTAQINAFSYYRFEVKFPGSDIPNFISQYNQPVEDGVLGTWDISNTSLD